MIARELNCPPTEQDSWSVDRFREAVAFIDKLEEAMEEQRNG